MKAYRLVEQRHTVGALSGDGAFQYGGRWNPPGHRVIYSSAHLSLAVLEIMVHLSDRRKMHDYLIIDLEVPDDQCEELATDALLAGWQERPDETRRLGREWLGQRRSLGLLVPSAVLPEETNLLINPAHEAMPRVRAGEPRPFRFEKRLL